MKGEGTMTGNPLMPDERRQQLMQQMLQNQMQPGTKSLEHNEKVLVDGPDWRMGLGGETEGVFVDPNGIKYTFQFPWIYSENLADQFWITGLRQH